MENFKLVLAITESKSYQLNEVKLINFLYYFEEYILLSAWAICLIPTQSYYDLFNSGKHFSYIDHSFF